MMYKKNFVAAIKVGGKVLRESSDRVELPFGSEYSVLLKNLDTVRMQARISIDGQEAVKWVVIDPGREIEIERYLHSTGSLDTGNRFKFIERTDKIEAHRGVKADDGLLRVEFKREKVYEAPKIVEHHDYYHYHYYPYWRPLTHYNFCGTLNHTSGSIGSNTRVLRGSGITGQSVHTQTAGLNMMAAQCMSEQKNDAGITVAGSLSDQRFHMVSDFQCENSEAIVIHLVGRKSGAVVRVAKTVKRKLECETCGRNNKSSAKFCTECGTSLEKV